MVLSTTTVILYQKSFIIISQPATKISHEKDQENLAIVFYNKHMFDSDLFRKDDVAIYSVLGGNLELKSV